MLLHGLDVPNIVHGNSLINDVLNYTDDDKFDVILMNPPYGGSEKKDVQNHFPRNQYRYLCRSHNAGIWYLAYDDHISNP